MQHFIPRRRKHLTVAAAVLVGAAVVAAGPSLRTTAEARDGMTVEAAEAATSPAPPGPGEGPGAPIVLATEEGSASYYANSLAGRRTASGVPYRPRAMIAAHRSLPFATRIRVENLANGRVVEVEVVDRGPFARGRILDVSRRAAEELGFVRQGHTRVRIEVLEYGDG